MRPDRYGDVHYMKSYGEVIDVADCSSPSYRRIYNDMVEVDLRFYDQISYRQFKEDLVAGRNASAEKNIREQYPTVKQAWDEYQLLLKLIK